MFQADAGAVVLNKPRIVCNITGGGCDEHHNHPTHPKGTTVTTPHTTPGTLDLTTHLPTNPTLRTEVVHARAVCDTKAHPPGCYNPNSDTTYCECGVVQYSGNHAPFPTPRRITPRGKFEGDLP